MIFVSSSEFIMKINYNSKKMDSLIKNLVEKLLSEGGLHSLNKGYLIYNVRNKIKDITSDECIEKHYWEIAERLLTKEGFLNDCNYLIYNNIQFVRVVSVSRNLCFTVTKSFFEKNDILKKIISFTKKEIPFDDLITFISYASKTYNNIQIFEMKCKHLENSIAEDKAESNSFGLLLDKGLTKLIFNLCLGYNIKYHNYYSKKNICIYSPGSL